VKHRPLTARQKKFVQLMASGRHTAKSAGEELGVHERTGQAWARRPDIEQAIQDALDGVLPQIRLDLTRLVRGSVDSALRGLNPEHAAEPGIRASGTLATNVLRSGRLLSFLSGARLGALQRADDSTAQASGWKLEDPEQVWTDGDSSSSAPVG